MSKTMLIQSASNLPQFLSEHAKEYAQKRPTLVAKLNQDMLARQDLRDLIGDKNSDMMCDNHENHARFIESILVEFDPTVLVDTVAWVYSTYPKHNFSHLYWPAQLNSWVSVLQDELSEDCFNNIYPLYHWFIVNQAYFVKLGEDDSVPT